jgi:hypothetical protein
VGGGWAAPTSCRAGDDSDGHDTHPAWLLQDSVHWSHSFTFTTMDTRLEVTRPGGGKCPEEERST